MDGTGLIRFVAHALAGAVLAALCLPQAAVAQSPAEFAKALSGEWYVFDPDLGTDESPCRITLASPGDGELGASASPAGCTAPLANVAAWRIFEGQLVLAEPTGEPVALLGGSQLRATGTLAASGEGLILERQGGDGSNVAFAEALRRHRCVYLGYTDECAPRGELGKPAFTDQGGLIAPVKVLGDLNVRSQPRQNAPIIGTVPRDSCVRVNACSIASEGVWCRARFGDGEGWMRKTALRRDEWPVLTYINGCS